MKGGAVSLASEGWREQLQPSGCRACHLFVCCLQLSLATSAPLVSLVLGKVSCVTAVHMHMHVHAHVHTYTYTLTLKATWPHCPQDFPRVWKVVLDVQIFFFGVYVYFDFIKKI